MSKVIVIEVDTDHNNNLAFAPLGERTVRGRFSHQRFAKHARDALMHADLWGPHIPGQYIGYDLATHEGLLLEPLHDERHADLRKQIAKRGMKLEPARQVFPLPSEDARAAWLWAMKQAVDLNAAKVIEGEFPKGLTPPKPKAGMVDPVERLALAIEGLLDRLSPKAASA